MLNFQTLSNRAILRIAGKDCFKFLQGIITNDINLLQKNGNIYTLMLTPQGRFLYDFLLLLHEDEIYIDHEAVFTKDIINKFNIYKLRADISVKNEADEWSVLAIPHPSHNIETIANQQIIIQDPRAEMLGFRAYVKKEDCSQFIEDHNMIEKSSIYDDIMYEHVIPEPHRDMEQERSFPLEYGIDNFHAISFNKGCYLGQEVTARTKHRGVIRKSLHKFISDNEITNVEFGAEITTGDSKIGIFCSAHGKIGKALMRIEEYEAAMHHSEGEGVAARVLGHSIKIF